AIPPKLDRFPVGGTGDIGEAATSELQEMIRGEEAAVLVIGDEAKGARIADAREGIDHRRAGATNVDGRAKLGATPHHNDPVHLLCEQRTDDTQFPLWIVLDIADEDEDLRGAQRVLNARDYRHVES